MSIGTSSAGFTPAFGTVGAPSFAVGTTGINVLSPGTTLQGVVAGVAVWAATAALLTITGNLIVNKGTLTASTPLEVNSAWNNSGVTFTAMKFSVADPAGNAGSTAGSLFVDFQGGTAGTTSVYSIRKDGRVTVAATTGGYYMGTLTGIEADSNNLLLKGNNAYTATVFSTAFRLDSAASLVWSSTSSFGGTNDTSLARESAGFIGSPGSLRIMNATAIPAGGTAGAGYKFSSTADFGVFFGSGAPSLAAAKGSLYLRSDGSGVADRAYINTNGSTTWTAIATAG